MGQNKRNKNQQRTRENSIENQQTAFTHSIEAIVYGRNNINNCKFHEYFCLLYSFDKMKTTLPLNKQTQNSLSLT